MSKETIIEEILNERVRQEEQWGNRTDDIVNRPNDWILYICSHATRWFNGGFVPYNSYVTNNFRDQMIKVAALALASIESLDRQREKNGKAFYEVDV
jgi:hypothetical protein